MKVLFLHGCGITAAVLLLLVRCMATTVHAGKCSVAFPLTMPGAWCTSSFDDAASRDCQACCTKRPYKDAHDRLLQEYKICPAYI